jgi:hypothetical protein
VHQSPKLGRVGFLQRLLETRCNLACAGVVVPRYRLPAHGDPEAVTVKLGQLVCVYAIEDRFRYGRGAMRTPLPSRGDSKGGGASSTRSAARALH